MLQVYLCWRPRWLEKHQKGTKGAQTATQAVSKISNYDGQKENMEYFSCYLCLPVIQAQKIELVSRSQRAPSYLVPQSQAALGANLCPAVWQRWLQLYPTM